jgi:hypothetical protein
MDRSIRRGNDRLNTRGPLDLMDASKDEFNEKVVLLEKKIAAVVEKIEAAGEQGDMDRANELMKEQDVLTHELESLKKDELQNPELRMEAKKMEVCEICGAFLIVGDCPTRVQAHLDGKQHLGYKRIREKHAEMKLEMDSQPRRDYGDRRRGNDDRRRRDDYDDRRRHDDRSHRPAPRRSRSRSRPRYDDVRSRDRY